MKSKSRAISATLWSGADVFLRQGLQFAASIALARLLSPEEFGTIAVLYLFAGIASAFVDSGLSVALVQRQDVSHTDESTVFWFNVAMGALVALCLCAAAPAIAGFYALPILVPLTVVMALNIFISALGSIHSTLLNKRLDFRTQMKVGAIATVISGAVAIVMAWLGYGVWALAVQSVAATGITTTLLWVFNRWRPAWVFSRASARRLFGFGGYMLASVLLDIAYNRGYTLLIGKFYGVGELGFYSRAESTRQLPVGMLAVILARVAFPIFSAAAHDKVQLRSGVRLALRGMMLITVPMMLGLAAVADPLVLILFGSQWLPAVPIMQVLCLGGMLWPLHVINLNALMAQGHSDLLFRLELVKLPLGVGLLVAGTFYGVMGIAWSQVAFGVLAFAINAHYTKRHLDYGALDQARDFLPVIAIALPMALGVHWVGAQLKAAPAVALLSLTVLGALIFLVLGWACRLAALRDAIELFKRRKPDAALRSSQATHAAVDNSAPFSTCPEPAYRSGKVVQSTGATSVSVIFITYNRSDLLEISFRSIREGMDFGNLHVEYIVSDDASDAAHLSRVRSLPFDKHVLSAKNRGLGNNCNKGIAAADGHYILQIQDDCEFVGERTLVSTAVQILQADPEVGSVQLTHQTPDVVHEMRRLEDGTRYRIYKNDGISRQRDCGARPYSDQPHLKRRQFCADIGPYMEGVPMSEMELDYQQRVACQHRWRVASIELAPGFKHLGASRSFNPAHVRARRLAQFEGYSLVGPILRRLRPAVRRMRDWVRGLGL